MSTPTPVCPLLVLGNMIGVSIDAGMKVSPEDSACLGSRCSWWVADADREETRGSCGLGNGQTYDDPAAQPAKAKPT